MVVHVLTHVGRHAFVTTMAHPTEAAWPDNLLKLKIAMASSRCCRTADLRCAGKRCATRREIVQSPSSSPAPVGLRASRQCGRGDRRRRPSFNCTVGLVFRSRQAHLRPVERRSFPTPAGDMLAMRP